MTELREFNEAGISAFRSYLTRVRDESMLEPPDILENLTLVKPVPGNVSIDQRSFSSKLEFGRYIHQAVHGRVPDRILRNSPGLWSWLSLFYIDAVCPRDGNGRRKVLKSLEKYIPSAGHISTNPDKHLLFFPWKMIALHGDEASWMLGDPLHLDSKVVRELANSYRRNVSEPYIKLARALYFDDENGRMRRGATTGRPGSLRRLDRVVSQLDMTYDVFGIDANNLASLLPRPEFRRWLPSESSAN